MASYKVPQDVEAEDKFLGPLTFKQFLFGGGFIISGYLIYLTFSNGVGLFSLLFFPFFVVFGALAFPWGQDQPTEVWLAGRFRYMFFPRKRIWDQTGAKELVTITVPKREKKVFSDGLKQDEVRNRFTAIADVVDSRGWAVKEDSLPSDRLVGAATVAPAKDRMSEPDVDRFDDRSSPLAGQFDSMIKSAENVRRQETKHMINDALKSEESRAGDPSAPPLPPVANSTKKSKKNTLSSRDNDWFNSHAPTKTDTSLDKIKSARPKHVEKTREQTPSASSSAQQIKDNQPDNAPLANTGVVNNSSKVPARKMDPSHQSQGQKPAPVVRTQKTKPATIRQTNTYNAPVKTTPNPGILTLAHNDDLSVGTIAREANRPNEEDEIVVELH